MCESLSPGITRRPSASTTGVPDPIRAATSPSSPTAGDAASGHGERGGLRPGGIPGRDPAVAEDEIGRSRHARARRSRCGYGCAGGGGGHFSLYFMRGFARVPAWLLAGDFRRPTAG
jgi:hypothetical protein